MATSWFAAADGIQQQWLLGRSIEMVARLRAIWEGVAALSHLGQEASADMRPMDG